MLPSGGKEAKLKMKTKFSFLVAVLCTLNYGGASKADVVVYKKSCGHDAFPRSAIDAPAVLRIFSHQQKRTFSTKSARSSHAGQFDGTS
jgi:hypothetical protein